jgi:hypothetical protein
MISIQEDGVINVMNRRGEFMKGFPFDTKNNINSEYFLKQSNTLANSSISVISTDGTLIEVSLEGNVIRRDQIIKESAGTVFSLLIDRLNKSFLIVRQNGNAYDILDDTGNLLFSKDYLSQSEILLQYYQFGAGKNVILLTDANEGNLFIYDKSGNLITGNPINSSFEASLLYSSARNEFEVYTSVGTSLEYYSFSY